MTETIWHTWKAAAAVDAALKVRRRHLPRLEQLQLHPQPYSRETLFAKMAAGVPVIFSDFDVPVVRRNGESRADAVAHLIRTSFRPNRTARVQTGPARTRGHLRVTTVMDRWERRRALVSVTDLHIRETPLEEALGVGTLSDFNILITGSDEMARQEMMTLVISSAGNVTNSHSDDPDGSNHCFTGCKLWLAWETFEGKAAGLEDDSRDDVNGHARFDLEAFLSLKSASWWTVSEGETLFLPGRLTHRVITLEHYLGVGSFFVGLPSAIHTIARWNVHGPLWCLKGARGKEGLVDEIARAVAQRIRVLRDAPERERVRWGLPYAQRAAAEWESCWSEPQRRRLLANRHFAELVEAARAVD